MGLRSSVLCSSVFLKDRTCEDGLSSGGGLINKSEGGRDGGRNRGLVQIAD